LSCLQLAEKLRDLHRDNIDTLDIFVGGMMETTSRGPGPLFTKIILDQMYRVRDGDRFWFENIENG
jgi:dual oxidase